MSVLIMVRAHDFAWKTWQIMHCVEVDGMNQEMELSQLLSMFRAVCLKAASKQIENCSNFLYIYWNMETLWASVGNPA